MTAVTCVAEMGVNCSEVLAKNLIDAHEDTLADVRQFASLSALLSVDAVDSYRLRQLHQPKQNNNEI